MTTTPEFKLNYENKYYIDITPTAAEPTWAELAPGITNVTPATNDVTSEDNYYDGVGFGETDVTGVKPSFALSGHRKVGDSAQDYIVSTQYKTGIGRRSHFKWVNTQGRQMIWPCTIINPVSSGGDAQSKENFSAEIRTNGAPTTDSEA